MRGDRPGVGGGGVGLPAFTPHARGSTVLVPFRRAAAAVYPACAGIDPNLLKFFMRLGCLPRMRGDRPMKKGRREFSAPFTPHARGSTVTCIDTSLLTPVYPACAGIDPILQTRHPRSKGLPRMRGDRPGIHRQDAARDMFTPHARGSTSP